MSHLEQLHKNVYENMVDFEKNATSYRAKTARYGYELLKRLTSNSRDVFAMNREEFMFEVQNEFNVNSEERVKDVAKFLHVHAQRVLDRERLAHLYKQVDAYMMQHVK